MSDLHFTIEGPRTRADAAWRLLSDTDWLNRVGRSGRVLSLSVTPDEGSYPAVTGVFRGPAGSRMAFEDTDVAWVSGRTFRQARAYAGRLLRRTVYEARIEADGAGVARATIGLTVEPGLRFLRPVVAAQLSMLRRLWQEELDKLPPPDGEVAEVPIRELPQVAADAFERWAQSTDPAFVGRVRQHVRTARPVELQRVRPFELARRWGIDREETLVSMLRGVVDGALELYWTVRCTRCHGAVASVTALSDLPDHTDCPSCRVGRDTDLGSNVEVLFTPHPAVLPKAQERFCTMFPMGAPDLSALFVLAPGSTVEESVPIGPGRWQLEADAALPEAHVHAVDDPVAPVELAWRAGGAPVSSHVRAGELRLALTNDLDRRARVHLSREGPHGDRVMASLLTTLPAFRRQMGHQVLAPNLRISVRSVTVLFTDLSGSTAMYEALGDAAAFAFVRDHFTVLRDAVEEHTGVVVKTIGDAVMAAFDEPSRALACALVMQRRFAAFSGGAALDVPVRLKVGLHTGPALAVHSDTAGMDYFGGTVNVAARAQGAAEGGEVVLTESVHAEPAVARLLEEVRVEAAPLTVELRGLARKIGLYRLRP